MTTRFLPKLKTMVGNHLFFFRSIFLFPLFFALNAAWSVRGGARLIVCVYFQERHQREKAFRRREENWTELFVIPGHGKREKFCVMWNILERKSSNLFSLQIIMSVLDWTSTKVKLAFFLAICLCIHETKCLSKREKANQIGNHCTQTHKREKENKFFTSFVGWYGAWRQRPHLYADWVRLASDTNQLLLLLFLRRPIFNAIRLIAVVVESDFCGYPQLQSKGSHLRHTDTHHIPIYGSDLTRRYTHGRNNKIQRKELLAVVYNSWYPSRKARRSQYALDFNFWN